MFGAHRAAVRRLQSLVMMRLPRALLLGALLLTACAATRPAPAPLLPAARAAVRAAIRAGAEKDPEASVHLGLARAAMLEGSALARKGDREQAELALLRACADAEIARALAQAAAVRAESKKAFEEARRMREASPDEDETESPADDEASPDGDDGEGDEP